MSSVKNENFTTERKKNIQKKYLLEYGEQKYEKMIYSAKDHYSSDSSIFVKLVDLMPGDLIRNFWGIPQKVEKIDLKNNKLDLVQAVDWNSTYKKGHENTCPYGGGLIEVFEKF